MTAIAPGRTECTPARTSLSATSSTLASTARAVQPSKRKLSPYLSDKDGKSWFTSILSVWVWFIVLLPERQGQSNQVSVNWVPICQIRTEKSIRSLWVWFILILHQVQGQSKQERGKWIPIAQIRTEKVGLPQSVPIECDLFYSCLNGKGSPTK